MDEEIAIYCGPGWEPWSPADAETRGLGGSEAAATGLAHALARRGCPVTVYADCADETHRRAAFRHWRAFDPASARRLVICSRLPELFDRRPAATATALWMHDLDYGPRLSAARAANVDLALVLTDWHARQVAARHPFLARKLLTLPNAIVHAHFDPRPWHERQPRVLCSSSPYRGLAELLRQWPRIRAAVPDAELHHCHAGVYDRLAERDQTCAATMRAIDDLSAATSGVVALGSLSHPELARAMSTSRVWAHPAYSAIHDAPFLETFCIGAVEAQAAGCHVVASAWGALPEVVRVGALIAGEPLSDAWHDSLVDAIIAGLTSQAVGDRAVAQGPPATAGFTWDAAARRLILLLDSAPSRRVAGAHRRPPEREPGSSSLPRCRE
jgi:glycosyltransferase involved in cell wall biosynthesis